MKLFTLAFLTLLTVQVFATEKSSSTHALFYTYETKTSGEYGLAVLFNGERVALLECSFPFRQSIDTTESYMKYCGSSAFPGDIDRAFYQDGNFGNKLIFSNYRNRTIAHGGVLTSFMDSYEVETLNMNTISVTRLVATYPTKENVQITTNHYTAKKVGEASLDYPASKLMIPAGVK